MHSIYPLFLPSPEAAAGHDEACLGGEAPGASTGSPPSLQGQLVSQRPHALIYSDAKETAGLKVFPPRQAKEWTLFFLI